MEITIKNEWENITINIKSNQREIYPAVCQNSLFLVCKPWGNENLNIYLKIAISTSGELKHVWTTEEHNANRYLHLDDHYESYNNEVEKTDKMLETIEGLFSGRIKIDGYKVAVGATAQIKKLNLEREEEKINEKIYIA